jgi:hypothetical protein
LPEDALPLLLQMMIADRFKFLVAHGTRFSHRRASLNAFGSRRSSIRRSSGGHRVAELIGTPEAGWSEALTFAEVRYS